MKTEKFQVPEWAYEFHGHKSPFMPIGYRMAIVAMEKLGIERCKDHEMHVLSEMGVGHPQGCMQDGIMAASSATFGKGMMEKLHYGKVAATFWYPGKGGIRLVLKNDFQDKLAPHEFFAYRKKGIEPSQIPAEVSQNIIDIVLTATVDELFTIQLLPNFVYTPVKGSFAKAKCEVCGEYTFERYLRVKDGKKVCIPCSQQEPAEHVVYRPLAENK